MNSKTNTIHGKYVICKTIPNHQLLILDFLSVCLFVRSIVLNSWIDIQLLPTKDNAFFKHLTQNSLIYFYLFLSISSGRYWQTAIRKQSQVHASKSQYTSLNKRKYYFMVQWTFYKFTFCTVIKCLTPLSGSS